MDGNHQFCDGPFGKYTKGIWDPFRTTYTVYTHFSKCNYYLYDYKSPKLRKCLRNRRIAINGDSTMREVALEIGHFLAMYYLEGEPTFENFLKEMENKLSTPTSDMMVRNRLYFSVNVANDNFLWKGNKPHAPRFHDWKFNFSMGHGDNLGFSGPYLGITGKYESENWLERWLNTSKTYDTFILTSILHDIVYLNYSCKPEALERYQNAITSTFHRVFEVQTTATLLWYGGVRM